MYTSINNFNSIELLNNNILVIKDIDNTLLYFDCDKDDLFFFDIVKDMIDPELSIEKKKIKLIKK